MGIYVAFWFCKPDFNALVDIFELNSIFKNDFTKGGGVFIFIYFSKLLSSRAWHHIRQKIQ